MGVDALKDLEKQVNFIIGHPVGSFKCLYCLVMTSKLGRLDSHVAKAVYLVMLRKIYSYFAETICVFPHSKVVLSTFCRSRSGSEWGPDYKLTWTLLLCLCGCMMIGPCAS